MLRRLTIRDFVIVDHLELELAAGFGALTGETGAGKSILLDALGLALGGRGEAGQVRTGRERADVTAEFDIPPAPAFAAWCAGQDIALDDGAVLLRRVIDASGRSRGWINGVPATLTQLREAGGWLADIHGQHGHLALMRADSQRELLDSHAGARDQAATTAAAHHAWQQARSRREQAEQATAASARQREELAWQVEELDALGFVAEEWEDLNLEQARLAHAAGLIGGAEEVLQMLADAEPAVAALLGRAHSRVDAMREIDPGLAEASELLASATIQVDEAVHTLRRYLDRLELDPQRLDDVDRRIGAITGAARKFRITPAELPQRLADSRARLAELDEGADLDRLREREAAAEKGYFAAAQQLGALRQPAAERLAQEVTDAMQTLAMSGGRFEVALVPLASGSAYGLESVEFRVAANTGQTPRALAKVASGGELSRIGLAIQVMTSRDSDTPTLIFDEVDVGIGGRVAEIVGKLLARLGSERQVLCVTHLPQVAACAHWQWNIAKRDVDGATVSAVTALDTAGRIEEIARMLGGVDITATTRKHAAEMLGQA